MNKRGSRLSPPRGQQGLASIVVVSVLIVIMTLITIGFTRLVNRSAVNSANRQFSASATYAAQSGINDVASYLKKYAINNPGSTLLPKSTTCTGNGSLIGNNSGGSSTHGPFYDKSQLSTTAGTQYTCLLLNPTPSNLVYTQVQNLKSQVVKINTSASAGALDKVMISWQPSNSQITGYPVSSSNLNDETTWNSSTGICKDSGGADASCIPMLRVAIFPISNGEALTAPQVQSKTIFLYPQGSGVTVPAKAYGSLSDGSLIPIPCTQNIGGSSDFNPTTNTGYICNVIINSLASAIAPSNTDTVYMRITPIYNQADVRLAVNDKFGNSLNFINDQAIVDVTAQTAGVVKRLQARVDTSSLVNGASGIDTNISSNINTIPEQSVRSANALCKREVVTTPSLSGFPPFINFDTPDTVCHDLSATTVVTNPVPTLALSITGNDGTDNGKRVCSTGDAPETSSWGCVTANNPDSPQNPVQQGTVYINSGATLDWNTTEATSCTATGGWSGNPLTSVSGPNHVGSGTQSFSGITTVTEYDLVCSRPGAPATTPTKKVFAWPPPTVTFNQTTVTAGDNFSLSWNVANAVTCSASTSAGVSFSNWSGNKSASSTPATFSEDQGAWPWNDNTSHTFFITCKDPIGRPATAQITLGAGQPNNCSPSSSCSGDVNPPACTAAWGITDNGDGTGTLTWNGSCPPSSPGSGYYQFTDCTANVAVLTNGCSWVGTGRSVTVGVGHYCGDYWAGADPWGWITQTGDECFDVYYPQVSITNFYALAWDNGADECGTRAPAGPAGFNNTWNCRNGYNAFNPEYFDVGDGALRYPINEPQQGCDDSGHRFSVCAGEIYVAAQLADGSHNGITCQLSSSNGNFGPSPFALPSWGTWFSGINYRWVGVGGVYPFGVTCNGPVPGPGGGPNTASASYNG